DRFPEDLSGGQKQRVVLARALVTGPALVVADEPVAMLDMSVRALVLDLMAGLRRELGLTYLLITHDLATAHLLCDRVAVMYLGTIVEIGAAADVLHRPRHPYTQALLDAVPRARPAARPRGRGAGRHPGSRRLPVPPAVPLRLRGLRAGRDRAAAPAGRRPGGRLPSPGARGTFSRAVTRPARRRRPPPGRRPGRASAGRRPRRRGAPGRRSSRPPARSGRRSGRASRRGAAWPGRGPRRRTLPTPDGAAPSRPRGPGHTRGRRRPGRPGWPAASRAGRRR